MHDAAAGVVVGEQRVGGGRADGRLLAGPQQAVEEPRHNGRIEAVLEDNWFTKWDQLKENIAGTKLQNVKCMPHAQMPIDN